MASRMIVLIGAKKLVMISYSQKTKKKGTETQVLPKYETPDIRAQMIASRVNLATRRNKVDAVGIVFDQHRVEDVFAAGNIMGRAHDKQIKVVIFPCPDHFEVAAAHFLVGAK
jgi:hypothetical protein